MNDTLKIIGGLAICGAILFVSCTLLNSVTPTGDTTNSTGGGASKYEGKQDIKSSPYFAAPDIYNMQSNENLVLLPKIKTRRLIYSTSISINQIFDRYLQGLLILTYCRCYSCINLLTYSWRYDIWNWFTATILF